MSMQQLSKLVEDGETEACVDLVRELLQKGTDPLEILDGMTQTMNRVGELFASLEIFLPQVMLAGEAMSAVVEIVKPELKTLDRVLVKGKVVIGVVKGDLHEIGKNIVKLMLETNGFEVKDLGYDVDALDFIKTAEEIGADFIGLSSLMTTTMPRQQEMIEFLKEKDLRHKYKVVIGGAPTSPEWSDKIGADLHCEDANCAAQKMATLID